MIDRSAEKAELARTAELEAQQIAGAQRRLAAHDATRLSELGSLDEREFELFLDLLGEALSRQSKDVAYVEATSTDGTLRIRLRPYRRWPASDDSDVDRHAHGGGLLPVHSECVFPRTGRARST